MTRLELLELLNSRELLNVVVGDPELPQRVGDGVQVLNLLDLVAPQGEDLQVVCKLDEVRADNE